MEIPLAFRGSSFDFASPAFLDQDLAVRIYALGEDRYALEGMCGEDTVVRNGLAELRASTAL